MKKEKRILIIVLISLCLVVALLALLKKFSINSPPTVMWLNQPVSPLLSPPSNSHHANPSTQLILTFPRAVRPSSVSTDSFVLYSKQHGQQGYHYQVTNESIVLTPTVAFNVAEQIQVSVKNPILATNATILVNGLVWQFQTGVLTGSGTFSQSTQSFGSSNSTAIALGDIDGDGDLDALLSNNTNGYSEVWLNNSTLAGKVSHNFINSGQRLGNGNISTIALGDLDNDGDLDAYIATLGQGDEVWLNEGGKQAGTLGLFTDSGQRLGRELTQDIALADVDSDGDLDVFAANMIGQANKLWLNTGNGTFEDSGQALGSADSRAVALGDLDDDGDLDAVVANWEKTGHALWLNKGGKQGGTIGYFDVATQTLKHTKGYALALGDLDQDGDLDILIGNTALQQDVLWLNNGGKQGGELGTFSKGEQRWGYTSSAALALGDIDGDADLDVIVGGYGQANEIWLNQGGKQTGQAGNFIKSNYHLGSGSTLALALGDLNGDGDLDIIIGNGNQEDNQVWLNNARPDLRINKHVNQAIVGPGELLTYTLSYSNSGEQSAQNITISDTISPPLQAIGYQSSHPITAIEGTSYQWQIGSLEPAEGGQITITVAISQNLTGRGQLITNTATIHTPNPREAPLGNKSSVVVTIFKAGLSVEPEPNSHTAAQSTPITLTINGPLEQAITQTLSLHSNFSGKLLGSLSTHPQNNGLQAIFTPNRPLYPGEIVQGTVLSNTWGSPLSPYQPYVWQFMAKTTPGGGYFKDSGQALGDHDSLSVALGDLDGDGDLDAFVGNSWGNTGINRFNKVWFNQGGQQNGELGYFIDSGQQLGDASSIGISLGDIDNDGDLDAFASNYARNNVLWINEGGQQGGSSGYFINSYQDLGMDAEKAILSDLDGDGDLDIFVMNYLSPDIIWINQGGIQGGTLGQFSDSGQRLGNISYDVALGDIDNDGDLDAFMGGDNKEEGNKLWLNMGGKQGGSLGIFKEDKQNSGMNIGNAVELGDLDNDGDLDIIIMSAYKKSFVWFNKGGKQGGTLGQFIESNQNLGQLSFSGIDLEDLDGDGDLDLLGIGLREITVFLNEGGFQGGNAGYFIKNKQRLRQLYNRNIDLGDLDNDGDLDMFIVRDEFDNKVWFNEGRPELGLSYTVEPSAPRPGQALTYTLHYSNSGTTVATQTQLLLSLPLGLSTINIQSRLPITPLTDINPYAWLIGSLAPATTGQLTITAWLSPSVAVGTLLTSTVRLTAANSSITPSITHSATTTEGYPELHLSKHSQPQAQASHLLPGQLITYTITLSNSGIGPARGIYLTDTLATNLRFSGWISNPGRYKDGTLYWSGTLSANHTLEIRYRTKLQAVQAFNSQFITNTVYLSLNNAPTPTLLNSQAVLRTKAAIIFCPIIIKLETP